MPACLQNDLRDESSETKLFVTGWGITSIDSKSDGFRIGQKKNSYKVTFIFIIFDI